MIPDSAINPLVEFSLRFTGLWLGYSYAIVYRVIWISTMCSTLVFQYWYLIKHFGSDDLPGLMDCLSITVSNNLLFFKLIIFWLKYSIFSDVLKMMMEDWAECASSSKRVEIMTDRVRLSHRYSKFFIGSYSIGVIFFMSFALFTQEKQLILKMQLPFNTMTSPIYELVNAMQFLHEFVAAATSGMMNALLVTLMLHVDGQVEIICQELGEVSEMVKKGKSYKRMLKGFIYRHQRVIILAKNIENIYSYIGLMQFLSNTLVIGLLGFLIVTSLESDQRSVILARTIPYYVLVNLEAFVLCFAGEFVRSKSKAIEKAAYETLWYELDPTESRSILFLIIRSQKRFKITAGKFMELSLEGFASMLKASASYVSVLYAMY